MKLEFEKVNFYHQVDIINTSISCAQAVGVIYNNGTNSWGIAYGEQGSYDDVKTFVDKLSESGYPSGYYHINSYGNIQGECHNINNHLVSKK